ncbi:MAG: FAD-dependent oxidoreductase [Labilithrix sp.]|nr:FAD-dependent oxidoreductase [Labilithrix sp.]
MDAELDVVIVGAGLSGLVCAHRLAQAGRRVRVVEARDRVGGRTLSAPLGRGRFDFGGQWIGPGQIRAVALARELELTTFPTFEKGRKLFVTRDAVTTYRLLVPRLSLVGLAGLARAFVKIEIASRRIPLSEPSRARRAAALDAQTAEDLVRGLPDDARALFAAAVRAVFGVEPRELSLLYFLWYQRAGGGFANLVGVAGGAQERRFVLGAQSLSTSLATRVESAGGSIVLGAPVTRIAQDDRGVTVDARGVEAVRARHAVVAAPLALSARVAYEGGALDVGALRAKLAARMPMGRMIKIVVLYDAPFWRTRGFSGEVVYAEGPLSVVFDNGSHDGVQAALVGFIGGDDAASFREKDASARRASVLAALVRAFGERARAPAEYVEHDWNAEEWSGGCPVATMPSGAMAACAQELRAPTGRIHWAGTETALASPGYLEGAIEAGERAAKEIIARSV